MECSRMNTLVHTHVAVERKIHGVKFGALMDMKITML